MDIVSIAETKTDTSFPSAQFVFEGYHWSYRLEISSKSEGILVYEKSSIPSRRLPCENLCNSTRAVIFEIDLRKEKWLVMSIYRPPSQSCEHFLNNLTNLIDFFADTYEYYLIMDDFNIEQSDPSLKAFLNSIATFMA